MRLKALLLWAVLFFGAGLPFEVSADVYFVRDVAVDVTARSAVLARQEALGVGYREALGRLMRRLVLPEDFDRLPKVTNAQAQSFARGLELANERTSARRYAADLSVRFDSASVRALLERAEIPYADLQAREALLVPLFAAAEKRLILWGDENPWRAALASIDLENITVPLTLPLGGASDALALSPQAARAGARSALLGLAEQYGARHVLIAQAEVFEHAKDGKAVKVSLTYIRPGEASPPRQTFVLEAEGALAPLLARAAQNAVDMAVDSWKRRTLIAHDEAQQIDALVSYASFSEWNAIRKRLESLGMASIRKVQSLSARQARISLNLRGSLDLLALALAQHDIDLAPPEGAGAAWTIRFRT